jgi:acetyltransferase-like isoleucine patch superfamily enzyme
MSLRDVVRGAISALIHRGWTAIRAAGAVTSRTPAGYRFRHLGDGACLAFPVGAIFGETWIEIGERTLVGERVSISAGMAPGVDLGPGSIVRIGTGCSIGRGSHIVGHQSIDIGDDVFTGPYVYITDQNHVYDDPDAPIGRQWPRNSPVLIGAGSWLGTGAIILPGSRLGRNTVVAGGAVVRGEFPDHCVLAGVPARVVRRYDPDLGWHTPADLPAADPAADPAAPHTTPHIPPHLVRPAAPPVPEPAAGAAAETAPRPSGLAPLSAAGLAAHPAEEQVAGPAPELVPVPPPGSRLPQPLDRTMF